MALSEPMHVGYIVRRYPRYSETFIVREILAHEEAGVEIDIFSLRPPNDGHFQDVIARVPYSFTARAKDIYLKSVRPDDLRRKLSDAAAVITVSDYNLAYLRKTYGPAAAQVQRIYNGLDLTEFTYATPEHRPPQIVA